jgi:hypothetical protein
MSDLRTRTPRYDLDDLTKQQLYQETIELHVQIARLRAALRELRQWDMFNGPNRVADADYWTARIDAALGESEPDASPAATKEVRK